MKRKIMIAAVAAAVIFAVIAILSVLAQRPALIWEIEMICCEISGGSWKDGKTGVSQMILPTFIQKNTLNIKKSMQTPAPSDFETLLSDEEPETDHSYYNPHFLLFCHAVSV